MRSATRAGAAALGAVLVLALAGCDDAPAPDAAPPTASPSDYRTDTSLPRPPAPDVIDVAALPAGAPPTVTYLADGALHWRGRTVPTDLPGDVGSPVLLGTAGGRLLVEGEERRRGTTFWAVDPSGHAERIGRGYDVEQYSPELVESTGHLFVWNADRTTPWRIWELDARTGRELATYDADRRPRGLAPADQAVVDGWLEGTASPGPVDDRTRDGALVVSSRAVGLDSGAFVLHVNVLRTVDDVKLARFSFDVGGDDDADVDRVRFEDRDHLLMRVTLGATEQVVVRCAITETTCERASEVVREVALGVS